ncbi:glycosyltransferase family 2 protein [Candidatus Pacearchaeota archaeon]|nr:glycosyltransferase family 2 protein [Candidatus Pacearchaeota archaeon]
MVKLDYSVVVPVYNEQGNILEIYKRLSKVFEKQSWELIFINDCSKDKSLEILKKLSGRIKEVKYLSFSRNFGHQAALTAGMDHAQGRAIITLDCDLQDPPELILEMIQKWKDGNDVVYARRRNRKDNFLKKWTALGYYKLLDKFSEVKIPRNVGDFRLVDRKVLDQLKGMKEKARYLRGMVAWLGFKYDFVDFDRPERENGETGYTLTKMARLAMDGILNFSMLPLKLGLLIGMISILSGGIFLLYMIIDTLRIGLGEYPLYKWLSVGFLIMMGFLFILMWLLGEYVGRIYDETKDRPIYVIRESN